jgi:hypothetical protein
MAIRPAISSQDNEQSKLKVEKYKKKNEEL